MIFKSVKCRSIDALGFFLAIVFIGCLFLSTTHALAFSQIQPDQKNRNSPFMQNRRVDPEPFFRESTDIIGITSLLVLHLILTACPPVRKRGTKMAENRRRKCTRSTGNDDAEEMRIITQLEKACQDQAICALLGGLTHDFNNILSSVLGCAELAKISLRRGANVEKDLDNIVKAALRARALGSQLLACVCQRGSQAFPIAVSLLIKTALKLITAILPTSITVGFQSGDFKGKTVADPVQFHRMLIILCAHASYGMEGHSGTIEIRLQDKRLDEQNVLQDIGQKPGRYLQLSIFGKVNGFSRENAECRSDVLRTTACRDIPFPGTALVQGILREMGGAISVCNESGKGTVFHVLVPEYDKEADEESNGSTVDH